MWTTPAHQLFPIKFPDLQLFAGVHDPPVRDLESPQSCVGAKRFSRLDQRCWAEVLSSSGGCSSEVATTGPFKTIPEIGTQGLGFTGSYSLKMHGSLYAAFDSEKPARKVRQQIHILFIFFIV